MVATAIDTPTYRAEASGSFSFSISAAGDAAFELVTPEGERRWDPAWNPRYLNSSKSLFETDEHDMRRVWLVDSLDRKLRRIRYVTIWPGHTLTTIDIAVSDEADRMSKVVVTYHRVSLTASQDDGVLHFQRHLRDQASEWQKAFERALKGRQL